MGWFKKADKVKGPRMRVVSEPMAGIIASERRWTLEEMGPYGNWSYAKMTRDEALAKDWIENLKAGGIHRRVEFETPP